MCVRISRLVAGINLVTTKKAWPHWSLRAHAPTMSKECAALASDDSRLSNTGVVSFDLQVCLNYVGVADDGEPRCELPTLTMRNCVLGAGSTVVPRKPGAKASSWGILWMAAWLVGLVLVLVALAQAVLVGHAVQKKKVVRESRRSMSPGRSPQASPANDAASPSPSAAGKAPASAAKRETATPKRTSTPKRASATPKQTSTPASVSRRTASPRASKKKD